MKWRMKCIFTGGIVVTMILVKYANDNDYDSSNHTNKNAEDYNRNNDYNNIDYGNKDANDSNNNKTL